VLRRIVRRALRHGYKLGCRKPFFHRLAADVAQEMGAAYPELVEGLARIEAVLLQEEQRFGETLENGMKILEAALGQLRSGDARMLDGETVFVLYDTHGFPVDLTATSRASAASRSTWPASSGRWSASGSRRVRKAASG